MRGINTIVGTVLLLALAIALIAAFFLFSNRSLNSVQSGASEQIENTKSIMGACIILDGVSNNKIYLRNCGVNPISNNSVSVYIDENRASISMPKNVGTESVEEIIVNDALSEGDYLVRVTYSGLSESVTAHMGTGTSTTTTVPPTTTTTVPPTTTTVPPTTTTTVPPTTTSSTTVSTTTTTVSTTTSTIFLPTPLLYLKFDESTGTTAYDSSGNGNNGVLINGPVWTTGRIGNSLNFDGTDSYVSMGNVLNIHNSITITAWIRPNDVETPHDIVCRNWETSHEGYEFGFEGGELLFRINPTSLSWDYTYSSGAALTTGTWQHVAVVYDESRIYFYKNGVLITNVPSSGILYPSTDPEVYLYAGVYASESDFLFSGSIDDLRIYDSALSGAQINQVYSYAP